MLQHSRWASRCKTILLQLTVFCSLSTLHSPLSAVCAGEPSKLTAVCHGAAGQVSGSLHVLDTGNGRWMIDCGSVIEEESRDRAVAQTLPPGLETVDAVFITHAHTDHLGRLPLLVDRGYGGPIYTTEPTAALAVPMLRVLLRCDRTIVRRWEWSKERRVWAEGNRKSLFVHWRDCKFRKQIAAENVEGATCSTQELFDRFDGRSPPVKASLCNECVADQVAAVLRLVRTVKCGAATELAPGVRVTFLDAGHIPGAASVLFDVAVGGENRRVLFSGDLGNGLSPLLAAPPPAPAVDALFVETTYGTVRRGDSVHLQRAEFRRAAAETVARGGIAWIPCFALDRTQKILYELQLAQSEKLLPDRLPIYCPSPTAKEVTALYREHRQSGWFLPAVADRAEAFSPRDVRTTVPSEKRLPRPCIIISTSDILISQWMRSLLGALLPDPSTGIFLVGWQSPDSAGHALLGGAQSLEIDGQEVVVRAKVHSFSCFSGHADAAEIDAWLQNVSRQATVVLVHGNEEERGTRAEQLRQRGWRRVVVPLSGEIIELNHPAPKMGGVP